MKILSRCCFALALLSLGGVPAGATEPAGCLRPLTAGPDPVAADCLFILRAAVGSAECPQPCLCDANSNGSIAADDALTCLRTAIGSASGFCRSCLASLPVPAVVAATATPIPLNFDEGDYCFYDDYCPMAFGMSLYLLGDGSGWISLEDGFFNAWTIAVTWQSQGDAATITPWSGGVKSGSGRYGDLSWSDFVIQVQDSDGDGVADTGGGSATLEFRYGDELLGEYLADYSGSFELGPDRAAPTLTAAVAAGSGPLSIVEAGIKVLSSQPLLAETLGEDVAMTVNGVAVESDLYPGLPEGPFVSWFWLYPKNVLPFDAAIDVDAGHLIDASGNLARSAHAAVTTMTDPGPLTSNPGFELPAGGWVNLSWHRAWWFPWPASGDYFGTAEGEYDPLLGYADVPAGASRLSFQVSVLEVNGCGSWGTPRVVLYSPAGGQVIDPEAEGPVVYCSECITGQYVPWTAVSFDVSGMAGQRVVVRAEGAHIGACYPDVDQSIALDDFRFE